MPTSKTVYVYRAGRAAPQTLVGIERLAGEGPVGGFVLELKDIWKGLLKKRAARAQSASRSGPEGTCLVAVVSTTAAAAAGMSTTATGMTTTGIAVG